MVTTLIAFLVGGGLASITAAIAPHIFNRNKVKAEAAKLVTDNAKLANDMVREVAEDLRTELDRVLLKCTKLETRVDELERDLDIHRYQAGKAIPLLKSAGYVAEADEMRTTLRIH